MRGVHVGKDVCVVGVMYNLGICMGEVSMCVGGYVYLYGNYVCICIHSNVYVEDCVCVCMWEKERSSVWMEASNIGKNKEDWEANFVS